MECQNIDSYLAYLEQGTQSALVQAYSFGQGTGAFMPPQDGLANPVAQGNLRLALDDSRFSFDVSFGKSTRDLSREENEALLTAFKQSTKLISRGRLVK